jgi:hypothetical protein
VGLALVAALTGCAGRADRARDHGASTSTVSPAPGPASNQANDPASTDNDLSDVDGLLSDVDSDLASADTPPADAD